ncbi:MAG: ribbon-helix-helix domain-containing protein [Methanoregula sp.]|jgi:Arc/MetJ-type ribon-helix-helix transcriptional regulator|uniref:ribbon-helix-helix domain-containing protein n=1 Tax=Methanoregula sp. TaxID=2052170 RepID=UPI003D145DE6
MPKKHGKPQEQISYHCPPEILKQIEEAVKEGGYSSRSDFITVAVRFYFENKDKRLTEEIKKFLVSEEGEEHIMTIFKKVNPKQKRNRSNTD